MNKKILIIIGVVIILAVIGVWMYIFLTGKTSPTEDSFAQFSEGGDRQTHDTDLFDFNNTNNTLPTTPQRLRQLTLRPVAGAGFLNEGISYVEQGTGHVFYINLSTGNESLVSGTTLTQTRDAVFSKNGTYVAITNYDGNKRTVVGSVSQEGKLDGVSLPTDASGVSFGEDENLLYYFTNSTDGTRGYEYDIESAVSVELFYVPLRDVRVIWGDEIYIYTTPSSEQTGFIYKIINNNLQYVTDGGFGLMAFGTKNGPVVTKSNGANLFSKPVEEDSSVLFGVLMPEKCSSVASATICAIPEEINENTFPDTWYKGTESYTDTLWDIDINNGSSGFLLNLLNESGRKIDVIKIGTNEGGDKTYFINKNDNTLWLFDSSL
ncbi:MAG: hypothetical protein DRI24_23625 [Deltaproteobacteria bacterium]|nr:MAG: hypothetical protein DRI24_23625 [Deltaproteobacteria bacterium]